MLIFTYHHSATINGDTFCLLNDVVENHKGVNAVQRCSIENQGTIIIDFVQR